MKTQGALRSLIRKWLLLELIISGVVVGTVSGQTPSSKIDLDSGSYLRARLLHEPRFKRGYAVRSGAVNRDPWLAFDKAEHVTFGFLFTLGGQYVFVNKAKLSEREALPLSIGVAASAGLAKELLDRRRRTGFFSTRDLVADAVGIALATTLILL